MRGTCVGRADLQMCGHRITCHGPPSPLTDHYFLPNPPWLQGTDLTGLLPVLSAVISNPGAREQLPGLLQTVLGGGSGSNSSSPGSGLNLGPLISAVLGDKEASAALPDLLGLLGKLGIGLPGAQ